MKILVDGDACPVNSEIMEISTKYNIEVLYFCSVCHYSETVKFSNRILVDNEDQAVDMKIINYLNSGDIVITQDYGLASLVLNKGAYALSFNGESFTNDNIELYLYQRFLSLEQRKKKLKTSKQKKRGKIEDFKFKKTLENLIGQLNNP
jgi:hypothetical protein